MAWKLRPDILLCPNTPKPLHQVVPRTILGRVWWDKTRKEAYKSTGDRCQACGVHKDFAKFKPWVEGHELYHIDYVAGISTYVETVPLCHGCHNYIHDGRMQAMVSKGEMSHSKYTQVIQHGDAVLAKANITKPRPYNGPTAAWEDWRLSLFGVLHPPKFKTKEEWEKHFNVFD